MWCFLLTKYQKYVFFLMIVLSDIFINSLADQPHNNIPSQTHVPYESRHSLHNVTTDDTSDNGDPVCS